MKIFDNIPYPNGEATGLAFGVDEGTKIPPSLKNICKEVGNNYLPKIGRDYHKYLDTTLESWAQQGVLLLNTHLTVRHGDAGGVHADIGWEKFTKTALDYLSRWDQSVIFMAWGNHAQKFLKDLNPMDNWFIRTSHPSPLSYTRTSSPFKNSKCFSKANEYLEQEGLKPINWTKTG